MPATVVTGDDTEVQPAGWPQEVLSAFEQDPQLMLLLLKDEADPGFPSFPVLRVDTHLKLFGELLPDCFINQGEGWLQVLADVMKAQQGKWVFLAATVPQTCRADRVCVGSALVFSAEANWRH